MKEIDLSVPKWINDFSSIYEGEINNIKRVEGGVVADIWCIEYVNGMKMVIRNTRFQNVSKVITNLVSAIKTGCLPNGFGFFEWKDCVISYYPWIAGKAQDDFNNNIEIVWDKLANIHMHEGFNSVNSIYENIFGEAKFILNHIDECIVFSNKNKESIETVCVEILDKLKECELLSLLNCRGRMTHGDPKPANVILLNNDIQFIDWDKICSLSPESDLVYSIFTGRINVNEKLQHIINIIDNDVKLHKDILVLAIKFIPKMYLLHDVFVYLKTGKRYDYIKGEVLQLWYPWRKIDEELRFWSI